MKLDTAEATPGAFKRAKAAPISAGQDAASSNLSAIAPPAPRRNGIAPPAHRRSVQTTDSWITPKWLIDRLGPFDLDPCECDPQPWPCAIEGYKSHGLLLPWHGFVWCNPPYGVALGSWLNRMALHGNGIALVFARTETNAFFSHAWPHARALLFLRGRLTFARPDGTLPRRGANSGGPSVLIAYGEEAERRLRQCADLGAVVQCIHSSCPSGATGKAQALLPLLEHACSEIAGETAAALVP